MKNRLLEGPGRTLECIHPKFIVDLVQGADAPRQSQIVPQQQLFRERLTQEVMAQTQLRPWAMSGVLNENDSLRLGLAEKTRQYARSRPSCADAYHPASGLITAG